MAGGYQKKNIISAFFSGKVTKDLLFPFPSISDDERLNLSILTDNLKAFLKNIDQKTIDTDGALSNDIFRGLADIGVFGIAMPEEYDGYGFSMHSYLRAIELLSSVSLSLSAAIGSAYSIGINTILRFGSEEHKQTLLSSFTSGDFIPSLACSEENSGSDIRSLDTKAELSKDGENYQITGSKKYVINADIANAFLILAKTSLDVRGRMHDRLSIFLVPRESEGLIIGKKWKKMGMRGLDVRQLSLDNVTVPRKNMIGQPGQGFSIVTTIFNDSRLTQSAGCLGIMKKIFRQALVDAQERKQFGKRIIEFDAIKEKLVQMAVSQYAVESMIYLLAGHSERPDVDLSLEIAACKIFATEALWYAADQGLQIAGGRGYMQEEPYEKNLRDARMHLIVNGTNEVLLLHIARSGLRQLSNRLQGLSEILSEPFKDPGSTLHGLITFASQKLSKMYPLDYLPDVSQQLLSSIMPSFERFRTSSGLSIQTQRLEFLIREFSSHLESVIIKEGGSLENNQYLLSRIAKTAIDIFAYSALLSRVQTQISEQIKKEDQIEQKLAHLFFEKTEVKIKDQIRGMIKNHDDLKNQIIDQLTRQIEQQESSS